MLIVVGCITIGVGVGGGVSASPVDNGCSNSSIERFLLIVSMGV